MKYKTGEAAALLDLTKEGLRYLTRKGVIACDQDENNRYRSFKRDCIIMLQRTRCWQKLGFPLEKAFHMTYAMGPERVTEELAAKEVQLEEQIEALRHSLDLIRESKARIEKLQEGARCWLEKRPGVVFFPSCGEDGTDPRELPRLQAEGLWGTSRPDILPARVIRLEDGAVTVGYAGEKADVEAAKLPVDGRVISIPEHLCYMEQLLLEQEDRLDPGALLSRIAQMGLRPAGDILVTTEFVLPVEPREFVFHTIRLVRIPVVPVQD